MATGTTRTVTVTDAAWVEIVAVGPTAEIRVRENEADPSVGATMTWKYVKPTTSDEAATMGVGESFTFSKGRGRTYSPGERAAYIRLISAGSVSFIVDESGV